MLQLNKTTLVVTITIYLFSCTLRPNSAKFTEKEAWQYFKQIALNAEYKTTKKIKKWATPIYYALEGKAYQLHHEEVKNITKELSELTHLHIQAIRKNEKANLIIFIGDRKDFVSKYAPSLKNKIKMKEGFFKIYWNNKKEIYKGIIFVNTRLRTLAQKHILREEITQSIGLLNDSYRYHDSIFQEKWTYDTHFAKIDKLLISILYHPKIKSGMNAHEVKPIFTELFAKYK